MRGGPDRFRQAKLEREKLHMTQTEVARAAGINKSSLSWFERGHTEMRIDALEKLARFYDKPISYLRRFMDAPMQESA